MAGNSQERTSHAGATGPTSRFDDLFGQLSHPARRHVLLRLRSADPGAEFTTGELVRGRPVAGLDRATLHHVHLPSLAAVGYVDWDRTAGTVGRGPGFERVVPFLDFLVEGDSSDDR